MDPILVLLIVLAAVGAVLLYLRLFGPPFYKVIRWFASLLSPRRKERPSPGPRGEVGPLGDDE